MADIQLGTTLGAATGTGALMKPYRMEGDSALYQEAVPAGTWKAELKLSRTDPKPVKGYAGASRGEVKFTRFYADSLGTKWPATVTISSSIPDFRTSAEKQAFILEALLAATKSEGQQCLSDRVIPQS